MTGRMGLIWYDIGVWHSKKRRNTMVLELEDGKIVTDLEDIDFLALVLVEWGEYRENEAEALVSANIENWADEMENIGVLLTLNADFVPSETITLIKVGEGEWIVEDMEEWEMEDFVDLLSLNIGGE